MSRFDDIKDEIECAIQEMEDGSGVDVTCHGVTRKSLSSPVTKAKELQEAGYLPDIDLAFEMLASDIVALGIIDRSELTIDGEEDTLMVLGITTDKADPCVRVACIRKP